MKDILQWIPNFLKGMLDVLERVQNMAGGKIRGHIIFWILIALFILFAILFLMWWSNSAYESFCTFLGHFNIHIQEVEVEIPSSLFSRILLSLIIVVAEVIFMIGLAGVIGAFLGTLTNIIFPGFTTYHIDKLFIELLPMIKRVKELDPNSETEQMLNDVTKLQERWQTRYPNRITRFLTTKMNREKFDKRKL